MGIRACWVCAIVAALGLRSAADEIVTADSLSSAGLVRFWQVQAPLRPGEQITDAYLVDDQLYLTSNQGFATAIHAPTGAVRWSRLVTAGGYRLPRPCHAGDRTVFVIPSAIIQFTRLFGEPISLTELRFPAGAGPVSDGRHIYFGGLNRRFYSFAINQDFETWKAATSAAFVSPAIIRGTSLYAVNSAGEVFAWTAANKVLRWTTRLDATVVAPPLVTDDGVFIAAQDQSLYLLDLEYGELRWRARLSSPLYDAPVVIGETAYQVSEADGLAAIHTAVVGVEDRVRWTYAEGRALLAASEDRAFVYDRSGDIVVLRATDGSVLHTISVGGFELPVRGSEEPSLLLASRDGNVVCLRPRNAPPLRPEALQAALRPAPPAPASQPVASTDAPASRPSAPQPGIDDLLRIGPSGPPLGGKSKVSRSFTGDRSGAPRPVEGAPPAPKP